MKVGMLMLEGIDAAAQAQRTARSEFCAQSQARMLTQLGVIAGLSVGGLFHDGMILHRSLMERAFLLRHLREHDEWDIFDDWSYLQQYGYNQKMQGQAATKDRLVPEEWAFLSKNREKFKRASKDPKVINWKRPYPEDTARDSGGQILYDAGYNYASNYVHPMMGDGEYDRRRLLDRSLDGTVVDRGTLLHNSGLMAMTIAWEAGDLPNLRWAGSIPTLSRALMTAIGDYSYKGHESAAAAVVEDYRAQRLYKISASP